MEKRTVILILLFFAFIVAGMFGYAYLKNTELTETTAQTDESEEQSDRYDSITRVDAKHFYIDGTHTLAGEILMPTPCDLLEATTTVAESMPEQVAVDFTVINNADFCAQVVTPQRFKVEATASPDATFNASFEGRPVDLNLIPAAEGETPDDFELFIKG